MKAYRIETIERFGEKEEVVKNEWIVSQPTDLTDVLIERIRDQPEGVYVSFRVSVVEFSTPEQIEKKVWFNRTREFIKSKGYWLLARI